MKIKPNPECKICKGGGEVYESEEFWGAPCTRVEICDCIFEQIPEGTPDDEQIELDLSDYSDGSCYLCGSPLERSGSNCTNSACDNHSETCIECEGFLAQNESLGLCANCQEDES